MLSIVVNFFNNSREARNTLYSMTRKYQLGAKDLPYEVIVIDHGSTKPLAAEEIQSYGDEFKYRFVPTTAVCPATNTPAAQHPWARLAEYYARTRGRPFQQVLRKAYFLGALPQEALSMSRTSMEHGERLWGQLKA